ncbi:hypothetical protein LSH36_454g05049 [Paralvinella palmiformis]|uniref:Globin domain-containing protein n=1 Tax=Paralvinella palmiformis TaxID=53620 RepID=A0AAD9JAA8_9ANNE|nr:hypothetical protein LSH36_454g05049 [Paralvinella palmiformis]
MPELSEEYKDAVMQSWEEVCKKIRDNGTELFIRLFQEHPEYQDYFKELKGYTMEELRTNKQMRIHGTRVMHALSSMIDSLDELDVAAGIMRKTIDTHFDVNVKTIVQYEDMFALMPQFMKDQAGDKYTEAAAAGWKIVTDVLISVSKERLAELQAQQAAMTSTLSEEHRIGVTQSWEAVCKNIRDNGTELFIRLFEEHPEYQEYFKELKGYTMDELRTNKQMRIHGTRVMHALSSMIDSLDELDVAAGIMRKTIDTHFDANVQTIVQYEDMFALMPQFMKDQAGDKYTEAAAAGWKIVTDVLISVSKERLAELQAQKAAMG